jgi:hypothetical protein
VTLADRIRALASALGQAGIPHAFGGAIALAYWTQEPRGTRDIDLNAFVPAHDARGVLAALPEGIRWTDAELAALADGGQARLWWDDTPVDLFLDYAPIHADAARDRRAVPFAGTEIEVLGPVQLAAFKAMFDRTRDWADIESMLAAGTLDESALRTALAPMLDADDPRWDRLTDATRRAGPA